MRPNCEESEVASNVVCYLISALELNHPLYLIPCLAELAFYPLILRKDDQQLPRPLTGSEPLS